MPVDVTEYRCLLISPSDLAPEREHLSKTVNDWNEQVGRTISARVALVKWESSTTPDLSGRPQGVVNTQIVDGCDLGIAMFWSKVGTATGDFKSGSVEEVERLLARGCRVMMYFKGDSIPQASLQDIQKYTELQEIKTGFMKRGLVQVFNGTAELDRAVLLHLTTVISELRFRAQQPNAIGQAPARLERPDVRVRVQPVMAAAGGAILAHFLGVSVENHSPHGCLPPELPS